ncbi:MAG: T9SS type A sorting domain-containing protein [Bacteroidota bacterium]
MKNILKINGMPEGDKTVRVYDVSGKLILEEKTTTGTLNLSNLPSQLYLVKIQLKNQLVNFKILKE